MSFKLNIFTPGGVVVNGYSCEELTIPTENGLINILKGHTHLISELGTGILIAKISGGQVRQFTIGGGLCKVLGPEVTILAKSSESPDKINQERATAALHKAQSRQAGANSVEVIKFQRKLERAKNRIKLANLK